MKTRIVSLTLALGLLGSGASFAADAFTGTWKLNERKSDIAKGMSRNRTVIYRDAFPFRNRVTIDGVDAHGKAFHAEWVGRFDGSDYEVTGDPGADMRAFRSVNDHTLDFSSKKNGKVTNSGRIIVSTDGKTRTVTIAGMTAKGKKYHGRMVYNKA